MKGNMKLAGCGLLGIAVLALVFVNNCGYKLSGSGKQIPAHIKSIYIPSFDNQTTRFLAEQFVTSAVRSEFIRRSRLALVDSRTKADSLLEGEILVFEVKPISSSKDLTANLYKVRISLSVRFLDLKNNTVIFEGKEIGFADSYDIDTGDFFSQETETLQKIAKKFADSVVTTILENF